MFPVGALKANGLARALGGLVPAVEKAVVIGVAVGAAERVVSHSRKAPSNRMGG